MNTGLLPVRNVDGLCGGCECAHFSPRIEKIKIYNAAIIVFFITRSS